MAKQLTIHERRVSIYPTEKYIKLLEGYTIENRVSKCQLPTQLLIRYFDDLPPEERQRLRDLTEPKSTKRAAKNGY